MTYKHVALGLVCAWLWAVVAAMWIMEKALGMAAFSLAIAMANIALVIPWERKR